MAKISVDLQPAKWQVKGPLTERASSTLIIVHGKIFFFLLNKMFIYIYLYLTSMFKPYEVE